MLFICNEDILRLRFSKFAMESREARAGAGTKRMSTMIVKLIDYVSLMDVQLTAHTHA